MAVATTENPLIEGLERLPVPATSLVIFGATGDLARRKLLPALYNLAHEGALPERFNLVGVSRRDQSDDDFRAQARESINEFSRRPPNADVLEGLLGRMRYLGNPFDNVPGYAKLGEALDELDAESGQPLNRVYYLSTAPEFFPVITEALKENGLHRSEHADVRVVIEKPFGTDLASARSLQEVVHSAFRERQVFRIDHYLGKETVQNVMAFRFANYMFEPVWNRNYIDHIQITAAEDLGIGSRAGYYDASGALRDLVQNHMLQLLTLVCMEPPTTFEANKVRDEKVKVLQAIEPPTPDQVAEMTVRARYTAGVVGGNEAPGYLEEEGVPQDSQTETYAALRLEVHNWRWAGVPIVLRTGKRLARKVTEIAVHLKPVPHLAFQSKGSVGVQPNQLILTVQPNEGVSLSLGAKIPGATMRIRPVNMEFLYGTSFMSQSPEAYERLILDAMRGDATLFTRNDEVDAQWSIIDPILKAWSEGRPPLAEYEAGTPGPAEADALLGEAPLEAALVDEVWSERDTTPARIEAALRRIVAEHYHSDHPFVPARVLNVVVIVDAEFRGEIENRFERVGRYHPSRLVLCAVEAGRTSLDAWAGVGTEDAEPVPGHIAVARERVEIEIGPKHLSKLDTIVDPLLVSDLATMVWAPHGHTEAVDSLRRLAQIVLVDTQDEPDVGDSLARVVDLSEHAYVVDLAWLRSTPWRERVAATFDPPHLRTALAGVSGVTVRHREDSLAAALLFCGWLSSRLGWKPGTLARSGRCLVGHARARRQEVRIQLDPVHQNAPGLAGVTLETASGEAVSLDRAPGGLQAVRRARDGTEQRWTVLGASRGEGGILGEGVRQALLRDPTYRPALACARVFAR